MSHVVFHFATLQGHKAKPSKARGLKNEFLPRFVPKVPWLTAYWYYRYYWQKLDDIEVSLKNTGLSYSAWANPNKTYNMQTTYYGGVYTKISAF